MPQGKVLFIFNDYLAHVRSVEMLYYADQNNIILLWCQVITRKLCNRLVEHFLNSSKLTSRNHQISGRSIIFSRNLKEFLLTLSLELHGKRQRVLSSALMGSCLPEFPSQLWSWSGTFFFAISDRGHSMNHKRSTRDLLTSTTGSCREGLPDDC